MADLGDVPLEQLVDRYCRGEVTAEDYYAEMDRRAHASVRRELEAGRDG